MTGYLIINILSITNFYDHYTQFSIIDLIKNAIVASTSPIDFVGVLRRNSLKLPINADIYRNCSNF